MRPRSRRCAAADGSCASRRAEDRLEQLFLGAEVVVEQAVRDTRVLCDVTHAARVIALVGKHANGRVEDEPTLVLLSSGTVGQRCECSASVASWCYATCWSSTSRATCPARSPAASSCVSVHG